MSTKLERTDRHNPNDNNYLSIQHIERYLFAQKLLTPGLKVLDIACGTGYGTAILREHGCDVLGADLDEVQVVQNRKNWRYENFQTADVLNLPFDKESFDAVVTFETIEHVVDGQRFLSEMYRVLKPSGLFICSTPNIAYTSHPTYHVKEYEPEEFFKLVETQFGEIQRYGQYFKFSDRFRDLYRWRVRNRLIKLFERVGIKELLKQLIRCRQKMVADESKRLVVGNSNEMITNARQQPSFYQVQPLGENKLLRIMIAVTTKTE